MSVRDRRLPPTGLTSFLTVYTNSPTQSLVHRSGGGRIVYWVEPIYIHTEFDGPPTMRGESPDGGP